MAPGFHAYDYNKFYYGYVTMVTQDKTYKWLECTLLKQFW